MARPKKQLADAEAAKMRDVEAYTHDDKKRTNNPIFDGVVRKYLPDFLIRLDNGKTLILETKGQETRRDKEKRKALFEWVAAVNSLGEYGEWCNDISYNIADVEGIIAKYI